MTPCEWQRGGASSPLARQHLINTDLTGLKFERAGGHIKTPHSPSRFADVLQRLLMMLFKTHDPMPERQSVMGPQRLHVGNLEAVALHHALDIADRVELAIGKSVSYTHLRAH